MNTASDMKALFEGQAVSLEKLRGETARQRIERIWRIRSYLLDPVRERQLCAAMQADLRKPRAEVVATEIGPVLMAMNHIKTHLRGWMQERWVPTPLSMAGLGSRVRYEPKGRALVISPWNYPLQLALNPAIHAIAAGNAIVFKPSEVSPAVSAFISEMVAELFDPSEVAVALGGVDVSTALLEQPFNHIFFTGSPAVGRIVMAAAAKHLASVTLELGGKSPAVVDATVNAGSVGAQTAWAKCLNTGQTCIAPDYGVVQAGQLEAFVAGFQKGVAKMYGPDPQASPDYGRMVNVKHFHRVKALVDEAVAGGAKVLAGGRMDEEDLYIAPTVLGGVGEGMRIMEEEIFGPVLPLLSFGDLSEVPEIVGRRPQPLSFYIMSKRRRNVRYLLDRTVSGGVLVNEYMLGSLNPNLPFGGVNGSGIGKSNGRHGFIEFSNERGLLRREWGTLSFVRPPFSDRMTALLKFLFRRL